MGLVIGADVLRLAEQRADCAGNRGKKHQAPCQGLEGINPSNAAGALVVRRLSRGQITLY